MFEKCVRWCLGQTHWHHTGWADGVYCAAPAMQLQVCAQGLYFCATTILLNREA